MHPTVNWLAFSSAPVTAKFTPPSMHSLCHLDVLVHIPTFEHLSGTKVRRVTFLYNTNLLHKPSLFPILAHL